jgi:hypothetical protein
MILTPILTCLLKVRSVMNLALVALKLMLLRLLASYQLILMKSNLSQSSANLTVETVGTEIATINRPLNPLGLHPKKPMFIGVDLRLNVGGGSAIALSM